MKKVIIVTSVLIFVLLLVAYIILWASSRKTYEVDFGVSFNQVHAESLGLDWRVVYQEMLTDLKPKYVRVAAMWSDVEAVKGEYDFSNVDFMMNMAAANNAKVVLVVGQKAPRWPECHVPGWLDYGQIEARQHLLTYVEKTIMRYRSHAALELWQVENEPFIQFKFGECENYDTLAVHEEIKLVRDLDPDHSIIVTDSGELSTWRKASRAGDFFGTTLYRIVQDGKGRTFSYDWLPPAFYRWKAQRWGSNLDRFYVSELQAEPWFTGSDPTNTPIEQQEKTMNPERLQKHFDYVERTGTSRAYLWGVEWWYYMMEQQGDDRYWEAVKRKM